MLKDEIKNENLPQTINMPTKKEMQYVNVNPALRDGKEEQRDQGKQGYIKQEAAKLSGIAGLSIDDATDVVRSRVKRILDDRDILFFASCSGEYIKVEQLLCSIGKFFGEKFIDPLTPIDIEYNRDIYLGIDKTCTLKMHESTPIIVGPIDTHTNNYIYQFDRIKKLNDKKKFRFIGADEMKCHHTDWLINGYIEAEKVALIFGAPASFKSFVVIDIGLSIAAGVAWHRHKVNQGAVLYICGEGQSGIRARIKAWEKHHKQSADNFYVSSSPVQILCKDWLADIEAEANKISDTGHAPKLIIIDTLNRNFGDGDENSTLDMTKFINGIDRLSYRLKCAIIIVHHSGLSDTKRSRGSSALLGAMDFEYSCKLSGSAGKKFITLTSTKTKDHAPPDPKVFEPVNIQIGTDNDGNPISSVALVETSTSTNNKLSTAQRIALDALKTVTIDDDASEDVWKAEAYAQIISATGTPDANRKAFNRAKKQLLDQGLIEAIDGKYKII